MMTIIPIGALSKKERRFWNIALLTFAGIGLYAYHQKRKEDILDYNYEKEIKNLNNNLGLL